MSVSALSFLFYFFSVPLFLLCPSLSSPLLSLLSFFSLSLGDDTKWPTRVDMSLNPNTINQCIFSRAGGRGRGHVIFYCFSYQPLFLSSFSESPLPSFLYFLPWRRHKMTNKSWRIIKQERKQNPHFLLFFFGYSVIGKIHTANNFVRKVVGSGLCRIPHTPSESTPWYLNVSTITKTCLFKYTENFTTKKWRFSDKIFWYLTYFCSKHWLWVLVRTASMRRF